MGSAGNPTPVRMPHAHPETFRQFINYIYTGKVRYIQIINFVIIYMFDFYCKILSLR